ncbi:MAG: hypothetical protein C0483_05820 [Pirellula sp.]|nr:hypothetical protein [Pirellula sp.]
MVSTWLRRLLFVFALGAFAVGVGVYSLYKAAQQVPDFYSEAVEIPPAVAEQASDQFSDQAFALANDVEKLGSWSALFTDEQINGWLATDLVEKHPLLLPPNFAHPRVKLLEDHAQLGVRYTVSGVETVAWMNVDARMTDTHEIALRFREIRAGAVPLPLATILDSITAVAKELELPLHWTSMDSDPTAVVGLPQSFKSGLHFELTKLKIAEGKLFVSGQTSQAAPEVATQVTQ